jgi:hypothetical protein
MHRLEASDDGAIGGLMIPVKARERISSLTNQKDQRKAEARYGLGELAKKMREEKGIEASKPRTYMRPRAMDLDKVISLFCSTNSCG